MTKAEAIPRYSVDSAGVLDLGKRNPGQTRLGRPPAERPFKADLHDPNKAFEKTSKKTFVKSLLNSSVLVKTFKIFHNYFHLALA
ncbi:hypothetical protein D3C87_1990190 [compost metagenome]